MSAYAAAYAPTPGGYGTYSGGYGAPPPGGLGSYKGAAAGSYAKGNSKGLGKTAGRRPAADRSDPAGIPMTFGPTPLTSNTPANGNSVGSNSQPSSSSGIGTGNGWPSVEQLVASVPVRPFPFTADPQNVAVGDRSGVEELRGVVPKPYAVGEDAEFLLLKRVLTDSEIAEIVATASKVLSDLVTVGKGRELDPSDDRPRFAVDLVEQGAYADTLDRVLKPLVESTLLPYIRKKYKCPSAALATARFRRYLPEERRFIGPHHEIGSFVTVAMGLQDPQAFTGGMFVQGSGRAFLDRRFVPLGRGDACLFQHDLQHGVEVQEGSRMELLLYFKDSPQAVIHNTSPWYYQAAEEGDATAQYGWAMSLAGQHNYTVASEWLGKACAQDHPEALHVQAEWLWEPPQGSGITVDTPRTIQLFRRAAELGNGRSQSRLGGILAQGVKGRVQQDAWEGKRLLRLAFEQDEPDAAFHLGQALMKEGDRDGATKLLSACAKGQPRACFQIAEMYREGHHQFQVDPHASVRYTKWAAHQGDAQALSNLGHLIINGIGVIRDDAKAVRLFRQAAKRGAPEGMLNYGLALLRGNGGVKVDYQEALEWAQKSAAQGHNLAQQQLPMFFNAAKNPNPPARSLPTTLDELQRLGVKDLRNLLHAEGIDFSDCVEKHELVSRAALHLLGDAEPWDAAPEYTILLEPLKKPRSELLKQREHQQHTASLPGTPSVVAPGSTSVNPTAETPEKVAARGEERIGITIGATASMSPAKPEPSDEVIEFEFQPQVAPKQVETPSKPLAETPTADSLSEPPHVRREDPVAPQQTPSHDRGFEAVD